MNAQSQGIASSLPNLNPEQAGWAHHAARLLTLHGFTASVLPLKLSQADWYLSPQMAFRPPPQSRAPLGAAADALVSALSLQEGILDTIEQSTGLAAEFNDHGIPDNGLACVVIARGQEPLGELAPLALPPIPCPASPPTPLPLLVAATRLTLDEAEQLGPSDMLLLSSQPWPLIEQRAGQLSSGLAFNPQTGRLTAAISTSFNNHEAHPMSDPADSGQMTVPVALQLPDTMLSQADLAKLAEAGSIDLGPVAEGLQVTISVGGLPVGKGEIVRVGDRFAVLVEEPAPAAPHSSNEEAEPDKPDLNETPPDNVDEMAAEAK